MTNTLYIHCAKLETINDKKDTATKHKLVPVVRLAVQCIVQLISGTRFCMFCWSTEKSDRSHGPVSIMNTVMKQ